MTKSEALKKMQEVKAYMTSGNPIWSVTEIGEAFDMAIEALEQPDLQPTCNQLATDCISRQAAIGGLSGHYVERTHLNDWQIGWNDALDWAKDTYLKGLPSALLPEIIRCKDCKWSDWYTAVDGHRYCYCMETGNGGRTEDDFCSYAERETDDERPD